MKFEMIEKVMQERGEVQAQQQSFRDEHEEAQAALAEAKSTYERTLTEAVTAGKRPDNRALDSLSDKISELSRKVERTGRAYEVTVHSLRPKTTNDEVISAWNGEYAPKYEAEIITPKVEAAMAARDAYIAAVIALKSAEQAYEDERVDVIYTLDPRRDLHNTVMYKLRSLAYIADLYFDKAEMHELSVGRNPKGAK